MSLKNNPYYTRYEYSDTSTIDPNVLATVLQVKQQKFDVEKQRLQNFSSQLNNIPLIKDETKKYFADRINTLRSEVEKVGKGVDLTKSGATDKIMAYIGQAADDIVMEDYRVAKIQENILKQAEDAKKNKGTGAYSDANLQYSLEGIRNWSNTDLGTRYTDPRTSYIPFVDTLAKATEVVAKIVPDVQVKMDRMGKYSFLTTKGEKVTDTRIISVLDNALMQDPNIGQQMKINAWSTYRGLDDNTFVQAVKEQAKVFDILTEKELSEARASLIDPKNKGKEQEINNYIAYIEKTQANNKKILSADPQVLAKGKDNYTFDLYKNNFYKGIIDIYAKDNITDRKITTDAGAIAEDRLKLNEDKFNYQKRKDNLDLLSKKNTDFIELVKLQETGGLNEGEYRARVESYVENYGGNITDVSNRVASMLLPPTQGSVDIPQQTGANYLSENIAETSQKLDGSYTDFINTYFKEPQKYLDNDGNPTSAAREAITNIELNTDVLKEGVVKKPAYYQNLQKITELENDFFVYNSKLTDSSKKDLNDSYSEIEQSLINTNIYRPSSSRPVVFSKNNDGTFSIKTTGFGVEIKSKYSKNFNSYEDMEKYLRELPIQEQYELFKGEGSFEKIKGEGFKDIDNIIQQSNIIPINRVGQAGYLKQVFELIGEEGKDKLGITPSKLEQIITTFKKGSQAKNISDIGDLSIESLPASGKYYLTNGNEKVEIPLSRGENREVSMYLQGLNSAINKQSTIKATDYTTREKLTQKPISEKIPVNVIADYGSITLSNDQIVRPIPFITAKKLDNRGGVVYDANFKYYIGDNEYTVDLEYLLEREISQGYSLQDITPTYESLLNTINSKDVSNRLTKIIEKTANQ